MPATLSPDEPRSSVIVARPVKPLCGKSVARSTLFHCVRDATLANPPCRFIETAPRHSPRAKSNAISASSNPSGDQRTNTLGFSPRNPNGKLIIGACKRTAVLKGGATGGVKRADGAKFGSPQADAFVMVPQGVSGPRFLVTRNFLAIMDYNLSHSYALAVGHLGDRIRGRGGFVASWPEVNYDLSYKQRVQLQKRLNALGFQTGGSDGRFGARTYEAILAYQKKNGLPLDGVPSVKLLQSLEKNG